MAKKKKMIDEASKKHGALKQEAVMGTSYVKGRMCVCMCDIWWAAVYMRACVRACVHACACVIGLCVVLYIHS